jgi:hypothetical protein
MTCFPEFLISADVAYLNFALELSVIFMEVCVGGGVHDVFPVGREAAAEELEVAPSDDCLFVYVLPSLLADAVLIDVNEVELEEGGLGI